jgi:hypothetical protein
VPHDVELGFHLCYGDFGAKHFIEPLDATKMTELANLIVAKLSKMAAQACSVRLRRLLDLRSPPVSPWPMQSKATEPMPCAQKCSRSS